MTGENILIIDDSPQNREFIVEYILSPNHFTPLVARDGLEGMEMARRHHPDLILLDLEMPRMNGMQVLDALNAERLEIPVILMTFHGSEEIAVEVYRKGVKDYVIKPFSVAEMYNAIEKSLTEVRLRQEKEQLTNRLISANANLNNRVQELRVLYNIGKSVTSLMDLKQLARKVVDAAIQLTSAEEGSIYLLEDNELICRATKRRGEEHSQAVNEPRSDPLVQRVIDTRKTLILTPDDLAPLRQQNRSAPYAAMATPLLIGGEVMGALMVHNISQETHVFANHDGGLLNALADYAAIAYANASSYQKLNRTKEDEKASIRHAFERFVAPTVVDKVLADPDSIELGGTRRTISVLFADLRGYSTFAEKAPPEQVVEMLNRYFSIATDIIFRYEGTLDKFLGDAVMAFFNAPTRQEDHAQRLIKTAIELQHTIQNTNKEQGGGLNFGIALHVGEAVVGYVGAAQAMTYTAIGDTVNIVQRLQEVASPGQVLMTKEAAHLVEDFAIIRQMGELPVRGRDNAVLVYELKGLKSFDS